MLVLSRKSQESVVDPDVPIHRSEVWERIRVEAAQVA